MMRDVDCTTAAYEFLTLFLFGKFLYLLYKQSVPNQKQPATLETLTLYFCKTIQLAANMNLMNQSLSATKSTSGKLEPEFYKVRGNSCSGYFNSTLKFQINDH